MDMGKFYLKENVGRDYTHALEMFVKVVGQFKTTKKLDATAVNQLSDIVRYVAKFVEEFSISSGLSEFKTAKEQLTKTMSLLDAGYEKMAKKNAKNDESDKDAEFEDDDMDTSGEEDMKDAGEDDELSGKNAKLDDFDGEDNEINPKPKASKTASAIKGNDINTEDKYM